MEGLRRDRRSHFVLLVAVGLAIAGCSSADNVVERPGRPTVVSHPSEPFTVASLPPGYSQTAAEVGRQYNPWGDDSEGTAEPFTVLAPKRSDGLSSRAIIVSITGFAGYEGGFAQASPSQVPTVRARQLSVGGHPAIFTPAHTETAPSLRRYPWSDLLVRRGSDLAVRVQARGNGSSLSQLEAVARGVRPRDQTLAPTVTTAPAGYNVVGSVDVGVVAAADPDVADSPLTSDSYRARPGNAVVHRATWIRTGTTSTLTAVTLPARGVVGGDSRLGRVRTSRGDDPRHAGRRRRIPGGRDRGDA